MKRCVLTGAVLLLTAAHAWATQKYDVRGLVLKIDPAHKSMLVSCESIPGYMEAMTMIYRVASPQVLKGLKQRDKISLTVDVSNNTVVDIKVLRAAP